MKYVNPLRVRSKCDIRGCTNRATWTVGKPTHRVLCTHYCTECLTKIINDAKETLEETVAKVEKDVKMPSESSEATDVSTEDETSTSQISVISTSSNEHEGGESIDQEDNTKAKVVPSADEYVCKHCGLTFKRPDELTEYKRHIAKCKGN